MPEKILTALFVKNAPAGKHNDGGGLWLYAREPGSARWVLRYTLNGARHDMGLGPAESVSLAEARQKAAAARAEIAQGRDPIREKHKQARAASKADSAFAIIAAQCFEARKAELKGDGKNGRWWSLVELHAIPALGRLPVDEIDGRAIRDCLAPIWHSKPDAAEKALHRIAIVLRHAAALGLPAGDGLVPLEAWRSAFYEASPAEPDTKRRQFSRAREELTERGRLVVADDVYRHAQPIVLGSLVSAIAREQGEP